MIYLILHKWTWQVISLFYVHTWNIIYIIIHSGWSLAWIFMKEMVKCHAMWEVSLQDSLVLFQGFSEPTQPQTFRPVDIPDLGENLAAQCRLPVCSCYQSIRACSAWHSCWNKMAEIGPTEQGEKSDFNPLYTVESDEFCVRWTCASRILVFRDLFTFIYQSLVKINSFFSPKMQNNIERKIYT